MGKNVSIKDIATSAKVSVTTVSRALDPLKSNLLNPITRENIIKISKGLNYHPNLAARRLKRKRNETISFVLPNNIFNPMARKPYLGSNFSLFQVLEGMITEAKNWNYDLKIKPLFDPKDQRSIISIVTSPNSDGIILYGNYELDGMHKEIVKQKIPYVLMSSYVLNNYNHPEVSIDPQNGTYEATNHLLGNGYEKIAFFCDNLSMLRERKANSTKQRFYGYRDALIEKDRFQENLLFQITNDMEFRKFIDSHKDNLPFTAAVCINDVMASTLVKELIYAGFKIPKDIAVIGYDNDPDCIGQGIPELSTIIPPCKELGKQGVRVLIKQIENGEKIAGKTLFPAVFIQKGTG